ncbi:tetratricopeptide repeat protein [Comamonas nitrativorans]|uniref:Tetratricopeptide repeat protein n=1 Tax=Comamonas nitrativorans TaxID=108437 RepID=A0ABV9H000_9BURK
MKIFLHPLHSLRRVVLVSFLLGAAVAHADNADITELLKSNQSQQALKLLDQRLAATPKDPQLRFLQGVALAMDNKNKEAIDTFSRLTEEYPELPEPYNNLAVLYANQNQLDKSRQALEQAIRTNPSYSTAHENLGDIYAKLASQAYSKALQLDGSHADSVKPKLALIHDLFSTGPGKAKAAGPATPSVSAPQPPAQAAVVAVAPAAPVAPVAAAPEPASAPATATPATPAAPAAAKAAAETAGTPATAAAKVETASAGKSAPAATEAVEAAVHAWAKAWESKNMAGYLAAYSPDFQTPGKQSRKRWEEERRVRIVGKSAISVQLSDLTVQMPQPDQATVRFSQHYKAGNLDTRSRKTLLLEQRSGQWLIVRETVGN